MSRAEPGRRPGRLRAATLLAAILATLALPATVAAHVTRTVGPYTILVILVEEPYFQDNHAGFEFWVHRGDVAVQGLDATVRARATGHGVTVDLAVSAPNSAGFYVADGTTNGAPFDPLGGGAWSLILTGTVEQTAINEVIPVVFPSYPRVATAPSAAVPAPAPDPARGMVVWLVLGFVMAIGLGGAVWSRGRGRPSSPVAVAPPGSVAPR